MCAGTLSRYKQSKGRGAYVDRLGALGINSAISGEPCTRVPGFPVPGYSYRTRVGYCIHREHCHSLEIRVEFGAYGMVIQVDSATARRGVRIR
eukprot:746084-Rhodomonas_salina.1